MLQSAIYSYLSTELPDTFVFNQKIPQLAPGTNGVPFPCLVFKILRSEIDYNTSGFSEWIVSSVSFEAVGTSAQSVDVLLEQLRQVLEDTTTLGSMTINFCHRTNYYTSNAEYIDGSDESIYNISSDYDISWTQARTTNT